MLKSLSKYKPVMGVVFNESPCTDKVKALRLIQVRRDIEIISWPGGDVLFYYNPDTKDVVYPNDIMYAYTVDGEPSTALEVIRAARSKGFNGNDTNGASRFLVDMGVRVKNNPLPTKKFTGLRSR